MWCFLAIASAQLVGPSTSRETSQALPQTVQMN
jgi:hypothetical protein